MTQEFNAHQMERIDEALLRELADRIKKLEPVLLYWLADVIRSVKEASQYPRQWHDEMLKFLSECE